MDDSTHIGDDLEALQHQIDDAVPQYEVFCAPQDVHVFAQLTETFTNIKITEHALLPLGVAVIVPRAKLEGGMFQMNIDFRDSEGLRSLHLPPRIPPQVV